LLGYDWAFGIFSGSVHLFGRRKKIRQKADEAVEGGFRKMI